MLLRPGAGGAHSALRPLYIAGFRRPLRGKEERGTGTGREGKRREEKNEGKGRRDEWSERGVKSKGTEGRGGKEG